MLLIFIIYTTKHNGNMGIIISKKINKSYTRNIIKRRIRFIYRINRHFISHKKIIIITKTKINSTNFKQLYKNILSIHKLLINNLSSKL